MGFVELEKKKITDGAKEMRWDVFISPFIVFFTASRSRLRLRLWRDDAVKNCFDSFFPFTVAGIQNRETKEKET